MGQHVAESCEALRPELLALGDVGFGHEPHVLDRDRLGLVLNARYSFEIGTANVLLLLALY